MTELTIICERSLSSFDEPDNKQENHRANDGVDDCAKDAATDDDPDQRQEPTSYHRADDADLPS